jgi:hypothetical protein
VGTFGRLVAVLGGGAIGVWVLLAAVSTVVLPRGEPVLLTRWVFVGMRSLFNLWGRRAKTYEQLDRSLAMYAPMSLVALPFIWVTLVIAGFASINWGFGVNPPREAFYLSGSSIFTLGYATPPDAPTHVASYVEAALGLGLIALLISYLPSIYNAFQRRELEVTRLTTRAGAPPSAITMIRRHHALARLDALDEIWDPWETWFYFSIPYDPDPHPDDPISIDRSEFDAAYDELASFGVPVRPQREQCWKDFKGWRVNYDTVLLALAGLTAAPYAPWSSDRSLRYQRPPLTRMRRRR